MLRLWVECKRLELEEVQVVVEVVLGKFVGVGKMAVAVTVEGIELGCFELETVEGIELGGFELETVVWKQGYLSGL